jgi:hypothetical protein
MASCSSIARLTGEPLQLFATQTARRKSFPSRIPNGRLDRPGAEVFRMAEACDTSMSPEARMFTEIELRRKEAHHGVASRAAAGWTQLQDSVGRPFNRHFESALIASRLPKSNPTSVDSCRQLGTVYPTLSSNNETIWLRPVSITMDRRAEAFGRESSWRACSLKLF